MRRYVIDQRFVAIDLWTVFSSMPSRCPITDRPTYRELRADIETLYAASAPLA